MLRKLAMNVWFNEGCLFGERKNCICLLLSVGFELDVAFGGLLLYYLSIEREHSTFMHSLYLMVVTHLGLG